MQRHLILAAQTPISSAVRASDNLQDFFASGTLVAAAPLQ